MDDNLIRPQLLTEVATRKNATGSMPAFLACGFCFSTPPHPPKMPPAQLREFMDEQVTDSQAAPAGESAAVSDGSSAASAADTAASSATPTTDTAASNVGDTSPASTRDALDNEYQDFQRKLREGDTPEPEKPVEAEAKPKEEVAEEAQATDETDPLAEFEDKPLTREQIDQKFPRTPTAMREGWAKSEEHRGQLLEERQSLGGDIGIEVAKEILPTILQTTTPTPETTDKLMDAIAETNFPLVRGMSEHLFSKAINEERINPATGNSFGDDFANNTLQTEFGDGYNYEKLLELVELDKAGLLDEARETHASLNAPSEAEKAAKAKADDLETRLAKVEGDKRTNVQKERERIDAEVDSHVSTKAMDAILPIADDYGWAASDGDKPEIAKAKITFGEFMTTWLESTFKTTPEWAAIEDLKAQGDAFRDGKPTRRYTTNLNNLENRVKYLFKQKVLEMQPFIKGTSLSSRNAQLANKNGNGHTKEAEIPALQPPTPDPQKTPEENRQDWDKWYTQSMRASQEVAGQV